MPKYEIYKFGEKRATIEAKDGQQAKRIYCREWAHVSPSDYWCGMTLYNVKKIKEETPCK